LPSAESVITKRFDAELRASIEVSAIAKRAPFVCAPVHRSRLFEELPCDSVSRPTLPRPPHPTPRS
jgi:hypothetical protein